jgi:hypothetical protein
MPEPLCVRLRIVAHVSVNSPVEPGINTFVGPTHLLGSDRLLQTARRLASNFPSLIYSVTIKINGGAIRLAHNSETAHGFCIDHKLSGVWRIRTIGD